MHEIQLENSIHRNINARLYRNQIIWTTNDQLKTKELNLNDRYAPCEIFETDIKRSNEKSTQFYYRMQYVDARRLLGERKTEQTDNFIFRHLIRTQTHRIKVTRNVMLMRRAAKQRKINVKCPSVLSQSHKINGITFSLSQSNVFELSTCTSWINFSLEIRNSQIEIHNSSWRAYKMSFVFENKPCLYSH